MPSAIAPAAHPSRHRAALTPAATVASGRPTPTQPTNSVPRRTGAATRNSPPTSATFATE